MILSCARPAGFPSVLAGLLALACSGPGPDRGAEAPDPASPPVDIGGSVHGEAGQALDAFLTELSGEGFSGSVLVASRGEILLEKGYGLADRATGTPVTADTLFEIGTLAKIFTAAAVLKLEAEGALSLDDAVETYAGPLQGDGGEATIHQLLVHTSGLFGPDDRIRYESREAFLDSVRRAAGDTPPGEKYHYSSAGYTLLAAIVEKASGLRFEDYLESRLFEPAGMTSTGFAWEMTAAGESDETGLATGYEGQFLDAQHAAPPPLDIWGSRGPSSIATTVGDLYRWVRALETGSILPPASVERMFTAFQGQAGYGWQVVDDSSLGRLVRRGGALPSFEASIRWYRDADLAVILALNSNMGFRIKAAKGIAAILAPHVEAPL